MNSRQPTALVTALTLSAGAVLLTAAAKRQGKIAGLPPMLMTVVIGGAGLLIDRTRTFS